MCGGGEFILIHFSECWVGGGGTSVWAVHVIHFN